MDIKEMQAKKAQVEKDISTLQNETSRNIFSLVEAFQAECGVMATLRMDKVEARRLQDSTPRYIYTPHLDVQL